MGPRRRKVLFAPDTLSGFHRSVPLLLLFLANPFHWASLGVWSARSVRPLN